MRARLVLTLLCLGAIALAGCAGRQPSSTRGGKDQATPTSAVATPSTQASSGEPPGGTARSDPRKVLPVPSDFGSGWKVNHLDNDAAEQEIQLLWAMAHCQAASDPRHYVQQHQAALGQAWVSLLGPGNGTGGSFTAYAQAKPGDGAGLFSRARARLSGCTAVQVWNTDTLIGGVTWAPLTPPAASGVDHAWAARASWNMQVSGGPDATSWILVLQRGDLIVVGHVRGGHGDLRRAAGILARRLAGATA